MHGTYQTRRAISRCITPSPDRIGQRACSTSHPSQITMRYRGSPIPSHAIGHNVILSRQISVQISDPIRLFHSLCKPCGKFNSAQSPWVALDSYLAYNLQPFIATVTHTQLNLHPRTVLHQFPHGDPAKPFTNQVNLFLRHISAFNIPSISHSPSTPNPQLR